MRLARRLAMLGLMTLAACNAPFPLDREAEMAALRDAKAPFATFRSLAYEKVGVPSETPFQILRGSEVMELETHGKTFAKGFELAQPDETASGSPVEIVLFSYVVQGGRAFHPIVTLLDADKVPLRSTKASDIRIARHETAGPNWKLQLLLRLADEERRRVRYFVVHTSREIVEVGFAPPDEPWQVAAATIIFIPIMMGSGRDAPPAYIASSPAGAFSMTIRERPR